MCTQEAGGCTQGSVLQYLTAQLQSNVYHAHTSLMCNSLFTFLLLTSHTQVSRLPEIQEQHLNNNHFYGRKL